MGKKGEKEHRGRFQAQGRNLEESEKWAKDKPLSLEEGKTLLETLKAKLHQDDRNMREKSFEECSLFMEFLHQNGGYRVKDAGKPLKKSFVAKRQERVDLEIQAGIAFDK